MSVGLGHTEIAQKDLRLTEETVPTMDIPFHSKLAIKYMAEIYLKVKHQIKCILNVQSIFSGISRGTLSSVHPTIL